MKRSPLFLAIRAVGAEFARRLYIPVAIIIGAIVLVLLIAGGILVSLSAWWWLLYVPIIIVSLLAGAVVLIAWIVLRTLRPTQNKVQRTAVKGFVDELQEVSETVQTPQFILFFRVIKDMVFPSEKGVINQLSSKVGTVRSDFRAIVASYKEDGRG